MPLTFAARNQPAARGHMSPRITRLEAEVERLEGTTTAGHPDAQVKLKTLIENMKAHFIELEGVAPAVEDD